jgi:hypothetical protein
LACFLKLQLLVVSGPPAPKDTSAVMASLTALALEENPLAMPMIALLSRYGSDVHSVSAPHDDCQFWVQGQSSHATPRQNAASNAPHTGDMH